MTRTNNTKRRCILVRENQAGVSAEVGHQIAKSQKNKVIWMYNKKEKTTGFVAYSVYVRDLWFASAEVRRQIALFLPVV